MRRRLSDSQGYVAILKLILILKWIKLLFASFARPKGGFDACWTILVTSQLTVNQLA